jgi:hypothetical protein
MSKHEEIKKVVEENESIDKQQAEANKVAKVFSHPLLIRSLKYLTLNKSQKQIYKQMLAQSKKVDLPKKKFNFENIFEVEHFNF